MDKLGFLDGAEAPNGEVAPEAPEVEATAAETPEQKESRERDERGRFKAKEEAPVSQPAPTPEAAPAVQPAPITEPTPQVPDGYVPVGVVKELREELRALKQPAQRAPTPQPPPDVFVDPEGYTNWSQQQIVNVQLNISEEMTRDKYGDELVDAARDWAMEQFQTRPGFAQEVFSQRNPYSYAVKAYQKQQSLSQLGDDPKEIQAYLAWKQAQSAQPVPPAPQPPPERPPQSIASAPSAGGLQHTAVGPGVAFDETIRK